MNLPKNLKRSILKCIRRLGRATNNRISQQTLINVRYVVNLTREMLRRGILTREPADPTRPISRGNRYVYKEAENDE